MVIDSRPVADQDENINVLGRKRGFRNGVGVLACAVLLALTSLSGCRVYVVGSTPPNPFLGEWHAEYTRDGVDYSTEYDFDNNGRYSYSSLETSPGVRDEIMTQGTYNYDDRTLFLTSESSDDSSQFEYEFTSDNELELKARVSASRTRAVVYHRHP